MISGESLTEQTLFREDVVQGLHENQSEIIERSRQHINQRLDALEQMLVTQFAGMQLHQNMQMGHNFPSSSARSVNKPVKLMRSHVRTSSDNVAQRDNGVRIRAAQYMGRCCTSNCTCSCHQHRKTRSSRLVAPVLGTLFANYAGLPILRTSCDSILCAREQAPFVSIEYWFPLWFLAWVIRLVIASYPANGLQLQLQTFRRVPISAQCVTSALDGNIEGMQSLFARGLASPYDLTEERNYSILRWAVYAERFDMCRFLLEQGADPNQEGANDKLWDEVLQGTVSESDYAKIKGLLDTSDYVDDHRFPTVHKIVLQMSGRSLEEELRSNKFAVNEIDSEGRTALFWAAARCDERSVVLLLAYGADANAMDTEGATPLYLATNEGGTGCIRLLLEAGARPNPTFSSRNTS
jgi:hypothetical protein